MRVRAAEPGQPLRCSAAAGTAKPSLAGGQVVPPRQLVVGAASRSTKEMASVGQAGRQSPSPSQ